VVATELDGVDFGILRAIQEDARNNTNREVADRVGVSATTVRKRLASMEGTGVRRGYAPTVDDGLAGFPLRVLYVCTPKISEREELVDVP
jgi:DNA-binding Lrp family transcriptional regulator